MVVTWQILDKNGGLITTCFKERDAIRAKEKLEARGEFARIDKIFDAHLKDRPPVVKKPRVPAKKHRKSDDEIIPAKHHPVVFFVQTGDIITSELGMATKHHGSVLKGITRLIVNTNGKIIPVVVKEEEGEEKSE